VRIDVAFTPAELRGADLRRTVVVIDVLRATTTMVHALASGARSVLPAGGVEEAARKADQIGRDAVVLCGERDCEPIRGFQLGNSPLEFTTERVAGKTLVMTTTNGTVALLAAAGADRCYIGALVNVSAVARRLAQEGGDALLLCAGRQGAFALEDALCAGLIVRGVREESGPVSGNDGMYAAARLSARRPTPALLARTAAGRRLREIGRRDDIAFCARQDLYEGVPVFDEHRIRMQDL
jgi:2-phosphosulfolactate phosphatase